MSARHTSRGSSKTKAKIERSQQRLSELKAKVKHSHALSMQRRAQRMQWWQTAFKTPLVGFYGWVFSSARSLWAAFMTILGWSPRSSSVLAKRHGELRTSPLRANSGRQSIRRAMHEPLEARQLLANDVFVIANDTSVFESGPLNGQFFVQLDTTHGSDVEVEYELKGTATLGDDYKAVVNGSPIGTATTGKLTIKMGETKAFIDIQAIDDDLYDGPAPEEIEFVITGVSPALTITKSSDVMEIIDNEAAPTVSITASKSTASETGPVDGEFTVALTGKSDVATEIELNYTGTALNGADYTASTNVTIPAGQLSTTVLVDVTDDNLVEGSETVVAMLGTIFSLNDLKAAGSTTATVTIADNDTATVSIAKVGDATEDATNGLAKIVMTKQSSSNTVIKFSVTGDATPGVDYTLNQLLEIEANDTVAGPQAGTGPQGLIGFGKLSNPNVVNSTTVPYVSITSKAATNAVANNDVYSFYTATGGVATFDIDSAGSFNAFLALYDANGVKLTSNDGGGKIDNNTVGLSADPFIAFTLPAAGLYFIEVSEGKELKANVVKAGSSAGPVPVGSEYTLHVSVTGSEGYGVIGAGSTQLPVVITVLPDTIVEPTELVKFQLDSIVSSNPGITLAPTAADLKATIQIFDNDAATVSIAGTKNGLEPSSDGQFTFTQSTKSSVDTHIKWTLDTTLSTTKHGNVTVPQVPGLGTAADPADHGLALSGTVIIPAGSTSVTLTVPVFDSTLLEEDETVVVNINSITIGNTNITKGVDQASILILDDDVAVVDLDAVVNTAVEGLANGVFRFFLSAPPGYPTGDPRTFDRDTVITYSVDPGSTATPGDDYTALTGKVTIPAFASFADVLVNAIDDGILEVPETVTIKILTIEPGADSNISLGVGSQQDTVTIVDVNKLTVNVVKFTDATEGKSTAPADGGVIGVFKLSTVGTGTTQWDTVVSYEVVLKSSTAIEGVDFAPLTGTATILKGAAGNSTTVAIDATGIYDDGLLEGTEFVTLKITGISPVSGPGLSVDAQNTATLSIFDNETGAVSIVATKDAAEGVTNGEFLIQLGGASPIPTVVEFDVINTKATGAATEGVDYKVLSRTVTIPAFMTSTAVAVEVINDTLPEGPETIDLLVTNILSGSPDYFVDSPVTPTKVTIFSDQEVSVSTWQDGFEGVQNGKFRVFLNTPGFGPSANNTDVVVSYNVLTGSANDATPDEDYTKLSGKVTIAPNATFADIIVDVTDDNVLEGTENVRIKLTGVTTAGGDLDIKLSSTPAQLTAELEIFDNDQAFVTVKASKTPGQDNPGSAVDGEFTVFISQPVDIPTVVTYTVVGTATPGVGEDYAELPGSVTIAAGKTSAVIPVQVFDDLLIEGTESVTIKLDEILDTDANPHPYVSDIYLGALGAVTKAPGVSQLTYRQGVSGYSGTSDTFVDQLSPSKFNGAATGLFLSLDGNGNQRQILLHFDDLFVSEGGVIPDGSPISAATLALASSGAIAANLHELLVSFDPNGVNWLNAIPGGNGQPGVQTDGIESGVLPVLSTTLLPGANLLDVTSSLQSWSSGSQNFGWLIDPNSPVFVSIGASENTTIVLRPQLTVDLDVSATVEIIDNDVAKVAVVGVVAGAEPTTKAKVIVGLVDGSGNQVKATNAVTVYYEDTLAGTASSGSDYQALVGKQTIVIPANQSTVAIEITVNDDSLIESTETVELKLTSIVSSNPAITLDATKAVGLVDIEDNDFGLVTVVKVNDGFEAGPIDGKFVVSLSNPSDVDTVINVTITGSATEDDDYTLKGVSSQQVTIPANFTSTTVVVDVIDDLISEGTETVILTLNGIASGNAAIVPGSPGQATVKIFDNDSLDLKLVATKPIAVEGYDVGELQFQLNFISDKATTVTYSVGGSATAFANATEPDYNAGAFPGIAAGLTTGTVVIPAGSKVVTFPVNAFEDYVDEGNEEVVLTITGVTNANGVSTTIVSNTVTIEDTLYQVKVVKTDSPASEPGPPLGSNGQMTFFITNPLPEDTVIKYSVGGTAKFTVDPISGKADYVALPGTIVLPAGQTSVALDIIVIDDELVEMPETVTVTIDSATTSGLSYKWPLLAPTPPTVFIDALAKTATETIADNDKATLSIAKVTHGAEGGADGKFVITQSLKASTATHVEYVVQNTSTATLGVDYDLGTNAPTQTAIIPAGQTQVFLDVIVDNDSEVELTETVVLKLTGTKLTTNPSITVGATNTATVEIADDDTALVSILATDSKGFEPGANNGKFTLFMTEPSSTPTLVTFNVTGDATRGNDYLLRDEEFTTIGNGNTVTIPAGQTSTTILVDVLDDLIVENDETVILQLTGTSNAKIGTNPATATVTIEDDDTATVSIAKTTDAKEGTVLTAVNGVFTITMTALSDEPTYITYEVQGSSTASNPSDHTLAKVGIITINAFSTQTQLIVPVVDDNVAEVDETVVVKLTGITGVHIPAITVDGTADTATVTIVDDDKSTLTITNVTIAEGNKGDAKVMEFVVTSDKAVDSGFTLDFKVGGGTATFGMDYTVTTASPLSFTGIAGETQVIQVTVTGDNIVEADETFTVELTTVSQASLVTTGAKATGTILNDDTAEFKVADSSKAEGTLANPGDKFTPFVEMPFEVTLSNPIDVETKVQVSFADLEAMGVNFDSFFDAKPTQAVPVGINGFDYDNKAWTLTFPAGKTDPQPFTVRIISDNIVEGGAGTPTVPVTFGSERFQVTLADLTKSRLTDTTDTAIGTIVDDDSATVSLIANDPLASEPGVTVDEGNGQFTLTQTFISDSDTVIKYTIGGTAVNGDDYQKLSGIVTIVAGQTFAKIDVLVINDDLVEIDETVIITLDSFISRDPNVTFAGKLTDTVTIFDADSTTVKVTASKPNASEPATDGEFLVELGQISSEPTVVSYVLTGSTATNGTDFKLLPGLVTIPAGQLSTTIAVEVIDDSTVEPTETVVLKLTSLVSPTNADIKIDAANTATVTIADDDGIFINVFTKVDGIEGKQDGAFIFKLTDLLGHPVAAPAGGITVSYGVSGTATDGDDYSSTLNGQIFFAPGNTERLLQVLVIDDNIVEPTETVIVNIVSTTPDDVAGEDILIGQGTATVQIFDNDGAAPTVESLTLNGGDAQRSNLTKMTVLFDQEVNFLPSAFSIEKRSDTVVDAVDFSFDNTNGLIVGAPTVVGGKTQVELTFAPNGNAFIDVAGSLVNGNYQIKIDATQVTGSFQFLDGNGNGTGGDDYVFGDDAVDGVYRLYGDIDGNTDVDLLDLIAFSNAFGSSAPGGSYVNGFDIDDNGDIDLLDLQAFADVFGSSRATGGF